MWNQWKRRIRKVDWFVGSEGKKNSCEIQLPNYLLVGGILLEWVVYFSVGFMITHELQAAWISTVQKDGANGLVNERYWAAQKPKYVARPKLAKPTFLWNFMQNARTKTSKYRERISLCRLGRPDGKKCWYILTKLRSAVVACYINVRPFLCCQKFLIWLS